MSRADHHKQRPPKPHEVALQRLKAHPLLGPVAGRIDFYGQEFRQTQSEKPTAYCLLRTSGAVYFDLRFKLREEQWLAVLSLATLVMAIGGLRRLSASDATHETELAVQLAALHWWHQMSAGKLPEEMLLSPESLQWGRLSVEEIAARLRVEPPADLADSGWTLTRSDQIRLLDASAPASVAWRTPNVPDYEQLFAQSLVDSAKQALQLRHDVNHPVRPGANPNSVGARAKRWLITHYPLLGSLLTQFELVEDGDVCERMRISVAAIHVGAGEIYLNPRRQLGLEQTKFVLAHEILHAGLNHSSRRQGREPYLWNVACDYVINDWLVTMNLGQPPDVGLLFDEELRGLPAEDIYLKLAADLRIRRKLSTLRGEAPDMLDDLPGRLFTDREEFCRRALQQGLDFHQSEGRGLLPAGLVEAIRTLNQPAIPWQAKLAEWIQERFPLQERRRSWARPSRRQSATPDTPRPRFIEPENDLATRTFGVIVDSSGSMDRVELGKALGAIVAYSQAQNVRQVRLVYCDAQPYDEGFVSIDALASRVQVRGRGGTVLQPAVNLLQGQRDFPKDCPILIITDGGCEDDLQVTRDHAFLLSAGARLPFATRNPVFEMR